MVSFYTMNKDERFMLHQYLLSINFVRHTIFRNHQIQVVSNVGYCYIALLLNCSAFGSLLYC